MKNDELLHLDKEVLAAMTETIKRFALLAEWKKWERRSRRAAGLYERDFARERADELKEILFGR